MEHRWYHGTLWQGMHFGAWFRLLARNRFAVSPSRLPASLTVTALTPLNSLLRWAQHLLFGGHAADLKIEPDPVFIIGHWRTGTSLLHELLALDPRHRCPTTYECFSPGHFLITGRLFPRLLGFMLPATRPMDNMQISFDSPQEDEFGLCLSGIPSPYAAIAFPNRPSLYPRYTDLEGLSEAEVEQWKQAFQTYLKYLLVGRPGQLVLKSPTHTFRVKILNQMFPQARFIHLVRDPYALFPSSVHVRTRFYQLYGLQRPRLKGIREEVFSTLISMHERLEEARPLVAAARFLDVRYEHLVKDPVLTVQSIYEHFGWHFAPVGPALEAYAARSRAFRTNRYQLSPQLRQEIARRWAGYFEKYGYALE